MEHVGGVRRPNVDDEEIPVPQYLIMFNDEWVPEHTPEQLQAKGVASREVVGEMRSAGVLVYTHGGIDASTALFSAVADGDSPVFSDGPYVETKEHLGGFCVVEVEDDAAARYWAGRLAVALDWPQEVHRFRGRGHERGDVAPTT
ncbi:YciI family protein [Jatrophihabitans sp. YIM 134969]